MPKILLPIAALLLSSLWTVAEAQPKPTPTPAPETTVCTAEFARMLVERQVAESKLVPETDKRIRLLLRTADFFWKPDEDAARKQLAEAFAFADARFKEKGFERRTEGQLIISLPDHRFQVISAIARVDAEWAKKLTEKVLEEYEQAAQEKKRDWVDENREISEMLSVAEQNAAVNPALSLALARRLMRYDLNPQWYFYLYAIARKNPALSDQIYGELVASAAAAETFRLLYLSAYPFGRERIIGAEKYNLGTSVPADFAPRPALERLFLQTLFRRAMTLTPENTALSKHVSLPETSVALSALNELGPVVAERHPALVESYQQARLYVSSLVTNEMLENMKANEKRQSEMNELSFDERLKGLEELDAAGKLRDFDVVNLIFRLKTEEQFAKFESWLAKIKEPRAREDAANFFYYRRAQIAVEEKRLDEARRHADRVAELEYRASLYFQIAEADLKTAKNRFQTLDTLNGVYKLADKADDSVTKAQVFFGLAGLYAKIDFPLAFDSLASGIRTTNKLDNPDIFETRLNRQMITKEGSFYAGYSVPGFDMEKTFLALGEHDFNLVLGQAESFADRYFRTIAVMATVKKCQEKKPEKRKRN